MSSFTTTAMNDRVAFDHRGSGPAIVFVAGAGPWRQIDPTTTRTAELLAERGFTTIVYDRVGRGESTASGPIGMDRELAAIAAMIKAAGGRAIVCGHSSGCALSLRAAVDGLDVAGLALWEAPLAPPDSGARELSEELRGLLARNRRDEALALYMRDMPPEILEIVTSIPAMIDQADSLQPDADALAWAESAPHEELFAGILTPVIAMIGTSSYDDVMVPAAESIVSSIPQARWTRVAGAEHDWEPEAMAEALASFAAATR